ncbi:MAG TPA: hypothetical protein VHZ96_15765 [Frankiaceae bacterium]|jgi:hypothetical protein|nr:hypothetical protein [Frankiaceae bacterium]
MMLRGRRSWDIPDVDDDIDWWSLLTIALALAGLVGVVVLVMFGGLSAGAAGGCGGG